MKLNVILIIMRNLNMTMTLVNKLLKFIEAKVKYAVLFRCSFIVLGYSSQSFVNPDARYSYENGSWRLLDDQWCNIDLSI